MKGNIQQITQSLELTILSRTKLAPVNPTQLSKMQEVAGRLFNREYLIGEAVLRLKEDTKKTYTQCEKGIQIMIDRDILIRFGNVVKIK